MRDSKRRTEHFNKLLMFHSSEKQQEFNEFSMNDTPLSLFYVVFAAEVASTLTMLLMSIARQLPLHISIPNIIRLIPLCCIMYYTYLLRKGLPSDRKSAALFLSRLVSVGDAYIISSALYTGVMIVTMTVPSSCGFYVCTNTSVMKPGTLFLTVCFPLLRAIVIKCHTPFANLCAMAIVFIHVALVLARVEADVPDIIGIITVVAVLMAVAGEHELSLRCAFVSQSELQEYVKANKVIANEARAKELQATELRHLIGNVAHDLKSPLHAFGFELDTLVRSYHPDSNPSQAGDVVIIPTAELSETVDLLNGICSFMLMTINRAIDYTKASSGVALVPSLETVDVCDVMAWVVRCNKRSHETTTIAVQPLPLGLCQFIITDKQWLMENLLCLVSNALKFTPAGVITIASSLIRAADTPGRNQLFSLSDEGRAAVTEDISDCADTLSSPFQDDDSSTELQPLSPTGDDMVVLVEVIDDGIGLSHAQQRELFQPFKQAQRRAGGTGLGLFSLSRRVERLTGCCGVSDRLDGQRGCRFWFTLPYRPDEVTAAAAKHEGGDCDPGNKSLGGESGLIDPATTSPAAVDMDSPLPSDPPPPALLVPMPAHVRKVGDGTDRLCVLLVEDSPMIQKTTVRALQLEGYHVDVASNGMECLTRLEQQSYHCVLMDIQMPILDGLETTRRIREKEALQGISLAASGSRLWIIGVSANSDSLSEEEAVLAGMDGYISKPLSAKALKSELSGLHNAM